MDARWKDEAEKGRPGKARRLMLVKRRAHADASDGQ